METTQERLQTALEGITKVENKIKRLHVIDFGDYLSQYREAYWSYFMVGDESGFTPYGTECLNKEIEVRYTAFLEGLECEGYNVRW